MNDLAQIHRANQSSVINTAMQAARAAGKFVIAKYAGLHLIDHREANDTHSAELAVAVLRENAEASERFELLAPTA